MKSSELELLISWFFSSNIPLSFSSKRVVSVLVLNSCLNVSYRSESF